MDKPTFLRELASRNDLWRQRELVQAFVCCLDPEEAAEALVQVALGNEMLRRYLLRKISRDTQVKGSLPCHERLLADLMAAFSTLDYGDKQSCGYCLSSIHSLLPGHLQGRLVLFFLRSAYIGMRRRGYKILRTDWDAAYESEVTSVWAKHHDTECAILIIEKFPDLFLLEHSDELERVLPNLAAAAKLFIRL